MNHIELDSFDWSLLKALQKNARLSNVALSERVSLSPSQCSRRLHRLEQSNLIEAYLTQLNATALGYQITAFVYITLDKSETDSKKIFQEAIEDIPQILECYSITGDADYWLRIISKDLPTLSELLDESLSNLPYIKSLTSTVALNRVKNAPSIPLPN